MAKSPKHQVEALLFSSGKAMSVSSLTELSRLSKAKVTRALKALKKDYDDRDSAIVIEQDGNEWKMTVRNEYLLLVKNIVADTELSRATMETLAVIADKQPEALQSEVVDTRGSGAYEHVSELEELGFIRKERSGRTYDLKLTEKFFEYFDVAGEQDIKAAFKRVKRPDKQEKLGDMEVVDVDEKEPVELPEKTPEEPEKREKPSLGKDRDEFLKDLDKRIEQITGKNDEHEDDPLLQREETEGPEDDDEDKDN